MLVLEVYATFRTIYTLAVHYRVAAKSTPLQNHQ